MFLHNFISHCFSACLFVGKSLVAFLIVFALYRKALQEESKPNANSVIFRLYLIVIGIYAGVQFFISFFMRIPACHRLTNQCDRWPLLRFVKWMRQVFIFLFNIFFSNLLTSLFCGFHHLLNFFMLILLFFVYQRNGIMLDAACMRVQLILSSNL